ncbi:MAG TPA: hypothetical protein VHM02_07190, partial [Thermoanaerobaculia bacterium]|nr:hypothetical protein [Thermoanaerobaculia bacterium]
MLDRGGRYVEGEAPSTAGSAAPPSGARPSSSRDSESTAPPSPAAAPRATKSAAWLVASGPLVGWREAALFVALGAAAGLGGAVLSLSREELGRAPDGGAALPAV